jgi:SanA protein
LKKFFSLLFSKKTFIRLSVLVICLLAVAIACNIWVIRSTRKNIYEDVQRIPERKTGLLLGASKRAYGRDNLYFLYRIDAAVALYQAGKINHIIVSGDNHKKEYDEATDMRDALISKGVPAEAITLDYAGFRTLDSVVRCKKIFGQDSITIISQGFHNERALFIAAYYNINAIAFNAKDVPARYAFKTSVREYLAKFKAVLDLYILHTQPKFLGKAETI